MYRQVSLYSKIFRMFWQLASHLFILFISKLESLARIDNLNLGGGGIEPLNMITLYQVLKFEKVPRKNRLLAKIDRISMKCFWLDFSIEKGVNNYKAENNKDFCMKNMG